MFDKGECGEAKKAVWRKLEATPKLVRKRPSGPHHRDSGSPLSRVEEITAVTQETPLEKLQASCDQYYTGSLIQVHGTFGPNPIPRPNFMMPSILTRWILLRFARNTVFLLLALVGLLSAFNLLARANEIVSADTPPYLSLFYYAQLRFPLFVSMAVPLAVLLAAIQTFGSLASQKEIIALQTAGFTPARLLWVLIGGTGLLALGQFLFNETLAADAALSLHHWESRDFEGLPLETHSADSGEWLAGKRFIAQIEEMNPEGNRLGNLTVLERGDSGLIRRYLTARSARYRETGWELAEVFEQNVESGQIHRYATLSVPLPVAPSDLSSLNRPVEALRYRQLVALAVGRVEPQQHPQSFYQTWAHHRVGQVASSLVMVLLAVPVAVQISRPGRRILFSILATGLGFSYFILDRILLALGETGSFPPILAAWTAHTLFAFIGVAIFTSQNSRA